METSRENYTELQLPPEEKPAWEIFRQEDHVTAAAVLLLFSAFILFWTFSQAGFSFQAAREPDAPRILQIDRSTTITPTKFLVDINQATIPELILLPGVAEKTAQKIIDERDANGPYTSIDDLIRVRGIGAKKVAAIRPHVLPITDSRQQTADISKLKTRN